MSQVCKKNTAAAAATNNAFCKEGTITLETDTGLAKFILADGQYNDAPYGPFIRDHTPSSSSEAGMKRQICFDSNYVYIWVDTDTVKRAALSSF